jgi:hypothetical protein
MLSPPPPHNHLQQLIAKYPQRVKRIRRGYATYRGSGEEYPQRVVEGWIARGLRSLSLPGLAPSSCGSLISADTVECMTELLAKAFKKVSEELPEYEQDAFAEWLLQVIENDEREWDALFATSAEKLEKLADRALTAYSEGRTEILDLGKLSKL